MLKNSYKSRYIAVREYFPYQERISDLYTLDRKKQTLLTFPGCKPILPSFEGSTITYPSYSSILYAHRQLPASQIVGGGSGGGESVALDSNYTAGSAGDCVMGRFIAHATMTLDKLYYYILSYAGTAANVNDINLEVRSGTLAAPDLTAPGLLGTFTMNPGAVLGWNAFTSINLALTSGSVYYFIVGDPDGNGTDTATVMSTVAASFPNGDSPAYYSPWYAVTSTNGGTTLSVRGRNPGMLAFFTNGDVFGASNFSSDTPTGTFERGMKVVNGFPFNLNIHALTVYPSGSANLSGAKVWSGSTGPTGSALMTSTSPIKDFSSTGTQVGFVFTSIQSISADTPFRATFTYGSSSTTPTRTLAIPADNTDLQSALPGRGNLIWTQDTSSAWVDNANGIPSIGIIVEEIGSIETLLAVRQYPRVPTERTYPIYGV